MKHGKKYVESAKLVDRANLYTTKEALDLVAQTSKAKFDETVEVHIRNKNTACSSSYQKGLRYRQGIGRS